MRPRSITNSLGAWMMFAQLMYSPCATLSSRVMRMVGCSCWSISGAHTSAVGPKFPAPRRKCFGLSVGKSVRLDTEPAIVPTPANSRCIAVFADLTYRDHDVANHETGGNAMRPEHHHV